MHTGTYSQEEVNLIEQSGLTLEELDAFWVAYPDQDLETAIGGCLMRKQQDQKSSSEAQAGE